MKAQHGKQYATYIDQARILFSDIEMHHPGFLPTLIDPIHNILSKKKERS